MGWIEQTKKQTIRTGGAQYYLQGLSENVSTVLGARKHCPLRLWTPYGIIDTGLDAVSKAEGKVGHDRVHIRESGAEQVAGQVAYWYGLKSSDIETIEFEDVLDDQALVISPSRITFFKRKMPRRVNQDRHPLTLTRNHQSPMLVRQWRARANACQSCRPWVVSQITDLVKQHSSAPGNVDERDLLRSSGALHRLGLDLGMYRSREVDCPEAAFVFDGLPRYPCEVEIEERSSGFMAQHHKRHWGKRLVVLCMEHDEPAALTGYTDVIELAEVGRLLKELA